MTRLLRFLRRYAGPYAPWYALGILLLLATNGLSVTIPLYLADAIDVLRVDGPRERVLRDALIVGLMGVAIIVVRSGSRVLFFTPGRLIEAAVKRDLFERLVHQQPVFLRQWPTGDLVSRASSDVNMLRLLTGFGLLQIANAIVAFGLTGWQMTRLSPTLALWVLGPIAVGLLLTQVFIQRMFVIVKRMQAFLADLSDFALSSYQGVATIQSFVAEGPFQERFGDRNRAHLGAELERAWLRTGIGPMLGLAASVNVFLLLYVGGPMAIRGEISVGELVAFTTLVAYLTGPLRSTSFLLSIVKQAQASLERIDEVMEPEPERPDLPDPEPAPETPPRIEVRGLSFAYPDDPDHEVLHDVSFTVESGRTLGILGPTGSGKSTLLRILARLYNPPPGTVFVDGIDLRRLDLEGWRRQVAYVPQSAFLFSEPLKDNVLLGAPDDGRLERALEMAALSVDIEALPRGVHSMVGESGIMLSGGQRQRTALARGLVRPHALLMLDDVLSAVDHATEHELITTLQGAATAPTTVLVAHRISALQHADHILVLRGGRIVDQGAHEDLVTRPGLYQDTWLRQHEAEGA